MTILKAAKRRLDCIMMEAQAFEHRVANLKATGKYREDDADLVRGTFIGPDPVYIGYSRPALRADKYPWHLDFRQAVDSAIYQMRKDGEIERIMRRAETSNAR